MTFHLVVPTLPPPLPKILQEGMSKVTCLTTFDLLPTTRIKENNKKLTRTCTQTTIYCSGVCIDFYAKLIGHHENLNWSKGAFTPNVKRVLSENLGGILGGTEF